MSFTNLFGQNVFGQQATTGTTAVSTNLDDPSFWIGPPPTHTKQKIIYSQIAADPMATGTTNTPMLPATTGGALMPAGPLSSLTSTLTIVGVSLPVWAWIAIGGAGVLLLAKK